MDRGTFSFFVCSSWCFSTSWCLKVRIWNSVHTIVKRHYCHTYHKMYIASKYKHEVIKCVWDVWHTFWILAPLGVECSVNSCCGHTASGVVIVSAYWIKSYVELRASAGVVKRNISASARELNSDNLPCNQALQSHSSLSRITQFCLHIKRKKEKDSDKKSG